jgi:hypothetical protein
VVDLSTRAFSLFAPLPRGRISDISVTPIGTAQSKIPKKDLPQNIFSSLGVSLLTPISNTYFAGDHILIEGRVTDGKKILLSYIENSATEEEVTRLISTDETGYFRAVLSFPKNPGVYSLILASGNAFS